jgi:hypothetical protein
MRVSRYALLLLLFAVSAGPPVIWSAAANAQQPTKPGESRAPSGGGTSADSKSAPNRGPKDIIVVDPCKAAHPPSYCNVKN